MNWPFHLKTSSPLIGEWQYLLGCSRADWRGKIAGRIRGCCHPHPERWHWASVWIAVGPPLHPRLRQRGHSGLSPSGSQGFVIKSQHCRGKKIFNNSATVCCRLFCAASRKSAIRVEQICDSLWPLCPEARQSWWTRWRWWKTVSGSWWADNGPDHLPPNLDRLPKPRHKENKS